ncbi:hypothetical protein HMPREF3136_07620 [Neisseria sp. HMSC15C08]|nr:hypothetical protein HMPREF3136_07620 [Neisseria sp. HMSC15C08]
MKYTVIAIIASAVAFGVQAYAKAQAYADYTTDAAFIDVDALDPYESVREDIAKQAMREAEEATRQQADEIEKLYQSLPPLEKVRGDAEVK